MGNCGFWGRGEKEGWMRDVGGVCTEHAVLYTYSSVDGVKCGVVRMWSLWRWWSGGVEGRGGGYP